MRGILIWEGEVGEDAFENMQKVMDKHEISFHVIGRQSN